MMRVDRRLERGMNHYYAFRGEPNSNLRVLRVYICRNYIALTFFLCVIMCVCHRSWASARWR